MEIGLGQGDIVLDRDSAPPPQKGGTSAPNFRPMYCGQTAQWIKVPLGTEVVLYPGDIVLDGDPALPKRKGHTPQFSTRLYCDQTAGWIKMPLATEVG